MRAGYDRIADRFAGWGARVEGDPRERFVAEFAVLVRPGGRVLDLGCGAGLPSTRWLAESFAVVGVDISAEQIARARRNVPAAELVLGDLRDIDFEAASFDGVCALYSISHVPRADHARLFASVRRWLRPGGIFLASLGAGDLAAWNGDWLASRCSSRATPRPRTAAFWAPPGLPPSATRSSRCGSRRATRRSSG